MTSATLRKINRTPALLSCLYDLGLLPEQLDEKSTEWQKMEIIVAHWPDSPENPGKPDNHPTGICGYEG